MESPLFSRQLDRLDGLHTFAWFMKRMGIEDIPIHHFLTGAEDPLPTTFLKTDDLIRACRRCIYHRLEAAPQSP